MAIERRPNDSLTAAALQAQIDAAKEGDLICLGAGRIRGRLVIDKPLTLRGAGAQLTILDGRGTGCTLAIEADHGEVFIEELSITGGRSSYGGGMSIDGEATVRVVGCTLERNSARSGRGGAVAIDRGKLYIEECTFAQNRAAVGGAIFIGGQAEVGIATSIIADNGAVKGGALAIVDGADVEIWTTRIENNQAELDGHQIVSYASKNNRPRIVLSNAIVGTAHLAGLPISLDPRYRTEIVLDNSTVGREVVQSFVLA